MKSTLDRMMQDPKFIEFMAYFKKSANYFAATSLGQIHAVDLCMAYAYEEGKSLHTIVKEK